LRLSVRSDPDVKARRAGGHLERRAAPGVADRRCHL